MRKSQQFQPMAQQDPRFSTPRRFGQTPRAPIPPRWANASVEKRKLSPRAQPDNRGGKKIRNQANEKLEVLHRDLKEILGSAENGNGIIALVKYIQPSQQETHQILDRVTEDLRSVLSRCFRYFDIHPFGSAVTGLLLKDSDLDFYVSIPEEMRQNLDQVLKEVERNLWRSRLFTKVVRIPRARVPLLKFLHCGMNVYCDLNFTNSMGIHSSGFIQHLIQFDYRIYPLMMVVKFWATTHELSGTGRITNYCLVMMVVFFLQTLSRAPLLPAVEVFQRNVPAVEVGGWNVAFDRTLKASLGNMACVERLLGDFFDFVANFGYENLLMCPLFGRSYKKDQFASAVEPPEEFKLYQAYVASHPEDTLPNLKPLCVQDPFELKMNIGASCGDKHLMKFTTAACFAAQILRESELNGVNLSKTLMRLFFENSLTVPMQKNPQKGSHNVSYAIPGVNPKSLLTVTLMPSKSELKLLKEITQREKIDGMSQMKEINKFWVDTMARFVVAILREIYLVQLAPETQSGAPGNSSSDYPKVFLGSTEVNVWAGRKPSGGDIEAEVAETERLRQTLQPPEVLKFSLILNTNNMYEYLQVTCIDRLMVRNNLKDFHQHFVENVRTLLNVYLQDYMRKSKQTKQAS